MDIMSKYLLTAVMSGEMQVCHDRSHGFSDFSILRAMFWWACPTENFASPHLGSS